MWIRPPNNPISRDLSASLDAEEDPDQENISVLSNDAGSADMDYELPHNIQLPHWTPKESSFLASKPGRKTQPPAFRSLLQLAYNRID